MRDLVIMAVICLVLDLASFAGLLLAVTHEQILAMDGLLLALISLVLCAIFSFNLLWLVLKTPLRNELRLALSHLPKFRPRATAKPQAAEVPEGQGSKTSQP